MITLSRPVRSGDTTGSVLTVRLPESTVQADRQGGRWVVQVTGNQAHRLRSLSKHWKVSGSSPVPPAPAPVPTPPVQVEEDTSATSFSVLFGTVQELEDELDQGVHDHHLEELMDAEMDGKDRSTAIRAILDRMETLDQ